MAGGGLNPQPLISFLSQLPLTTQPRQLFFEYPLA